MRKRMFLGPLALLLFWVGGASAQVICPLNGTLSTKLVCVVPQVYGPWGLNAGNPASESLLLTNGHQGHFGASFLGAAGPTNGSISEAVGIQVSQLPLASASSAITFTYDTTLRTFVPSTDKSLGPILGERASTIGHHKLFVGFSYQYFDFGSKDGQRLKDIPSVFQSEETPVPNGDNLPACSNQTALPTVEPCDVRDYIQTTNSISLKVNQYTLYGTYGVSPHFDISVAIPILSVQMGVSSNATIVPNSAAPASKNFPSNVWEQFNTTLPQCAASTLAGTACLNAAFSDAGSATGIGDVVLRGKYKIYDGERLGVAVGMDVRLPTGDAQNFLGSGAIGIKPFAVFSIRARVSPHVEVGQEANLSSILAGDFVGANASGAPATLPNRFIYVVGADAAIGKGLSAAFDIYGQRLFHAPELVSQPYTDLGNCSGPSPTGAECPTYTPGTTHPNVGVITANYNALDASLGLKYRVYRNLVITGNVLLKLDNGGLRAKAIPLIGASYNF